MILTMASSSTNRKKRAWVTTFQSVSEETLRGLRFPLALIGLYTATITGF